MEKIGDMSLLQLEYHINRIIDSRLNNDHLLTMKQAMTLLNVKTKSTFYTYREKLNLTPKKIGRSVRYSKKELLSKMNEL